MVFSSASFIFVFLPLTLVAYLAAELSGSIRAKNAVLLVCSFIFYAWSGVKYALLLCVSVAVNYALGLKIGQNEGTSGAGSIGRDKTGVSAVTVDGPAQGTSGAGSIGRNRKFLLTAGVCWNVGILFYYKYLGLFVPSFHVLMPIGISFFTFQIMSYLFDVYYGTVPAQRSYPRLLLYVMLFPQLIAGPIVRYHDVNVAVGCRRSDAAEVHDGLRRFMMGFIKKVFLANHMGLMADAAFGMVPALSTSEAWLGILCYTLQIYLDFSAYSDMAIGLGQVFGFHFLENFNYPYISGTMQEFWRRWHISLSSWFRDYVYIPLGGSRRGSGRTYVNLIIIFLLTGFWHGAAWSFVLWGAYHGLFLILERLGLGRILKKLPAPFRHIYTLLAVMCGWVFFRAESIGDAFLYLKCMFGQRVFGLYHIEIAELITNEFLTMLAISLVICVPVVRIVMEKIDSAGADGVGNIGSILVDLTVLGLFALAVLYMLGASFNPFIYFRF
ncbi:MAG: MBOAT family protein [Lachnospiraceae bacterium]|nr:MBOAT family protein [Lachnospiraceae bacterium]